MESDSWRYGLDDSVSSGIITKDNSPGSKTEQFTTKRTMKTLTICLLSLLCVVFSDYLGDGVDPLTYATKQRVLQFGDEHVMTENILTDNIAHHSQTIKWDTEYKLERTLNIEAKASVWKLSGSYAESRKYIHEQTSSASNLVTQDAIRMVTFQKTLNFDGRHFVESLERRLTDIGWMLTHNTERSVHRADYEMASILNTYGAAIITKKLEGGVAVMHRTVDTSKTTDMTQSTISRAASASFMSFVSGKVSYAVTETEKHSLEKATLAIELTLVGGNPINIQMNQTIYDWQNSVFDKPATHVMYASPWSDLITAQNIRNLSAVQVQMVRAHYIKHVDKYFNQNTKVGCTDPTSSKYMYLANKHDQARCLYETRFPLGGFYQTSSDPSSSVRNEVTQDFSCPVSYTAYSMPLYYKY